jgi:hypothetical protein
MLKHRESRQKTKMKISLSRHQNISGMIEGIKETLENAQEGTKKKNQPYVKAIKALLTFKSAMDDLVFEEYYLDIPIKDLNEIYYGRKK